MASPKRSLPGDLNKEARFPCPSPVKFMGISDSTLDSTANIPIPSFNFPDLADLPPPPPSNPDSLDAVINPLNDPDASETADSVAQTTAPDDYIHVVGGECKSTLNGPSSPPPPLCRLA